MFKQIKNRLCYLCNEYGYYFEWTGIDYEGYDEYDVERCICNDENIVSFLYNYIKRRISLCLK